MSLVAKLFIEEQEINLFDLNFRFSRSVDATGKPMGKPRGTVFKLVFEATRGRHDFFMDWAVDTHMMKNAKIVISPVTATSKSRVMELYDVCCIHHQIHFKNGQDTELNVERNPRIDALLRSDRGASLLLEVHLTPAILINDGVKILEHYWKKTDLNANEVAATTVEPEKEPQLIESYYENKEGKRINDEELQIGDEVFLVICSKNGIGEMVTISLANNTRDFEYQGKHLKDDILRDIKITSDIQRIALKTVEQRIIDQEELVSSANDLA